LAGRDSPNARRELDGRYARVRGPLKPASTRHLIGVWVREQTIRLKRLGATFEDIAHELTLAGLGRGTLVSGTGGARVPLVPLPAGVEFPAGYRITKQAVGKAFHQEIRGRVELQASELRQLAADRLEMMYTAAVAGALRGDPRSIRAGILAVIQHARLLGYAAPEKREHTGNGGKPLFTDFLAAVDEFRENYDGERDSD
jgi:hypothetical protein